MLLRSEFGGIERWLSVMNQSENEEDDAYDG